MAQNSQKSTSLTRYKLPACHAGAAQRVGGPPATYLSRRSRIALRRIAPLRSKCSTLDLWTLDRLAIATKRLKIHEDRAKWLNPLFPKTNRWHFYSRFHPVSQIPWAAEQATKARLPLLDIATSPPPNCGLRVQMSQDRSHRHRIE